MLAAALVNANDDSIGSVLWRLSLESFLPSSLLTDSRLRRTETEEQFG